MIEVLVGSDRDDLVFSPFKNMDEVNKFIESSKFERSQCYINETTYNENVDIAMNHIGILYNLKPNNKFPSDRELKRTLGISRDSIRTYIAIYRYMGKIKTHHGADSVWIG